MNGTRRESCCVQRQRPQRRKHLPSLLRYALKELENEGIDTELIELSGVKFTVASHAANLLKTKTAAVRKTAAIMGNAYIEKMEQADGILLRLAHLCRRHLS